MKITSLIALLAFFAALGLRAQVVNPPGAPQAAAGWTVIGGTTSTSNKVAIGAAVPSYAPSVSAAIGGSLYLVGPTTALGPYSEYSFGPTFLGVIDPIYNVGINATAAGPEFANIPSLWTAMEGNYANATYQKGLATVAYTSGLTATGSGTCTLATTNGTSTVAGTFTLTVTAGSVGATGTILTAGLGYASAPTTATVSSYTSSSCSGTATISSTISGVQRTYGEWYIDAIDAAGNNFRPLAFTFDNTLMTDYMAGSLYISNETGGSFSFINPANGDLTYTFKGNGEFTAKNPSTGAVTLDLQPNGELQVANFINFLNSNPYLENTSNTPLAFIVNGHYTWAANTLDGFQFGTAQDTNLYRSATNTLKTDGALNVTGLEANHGTQINGTLYSVAGTALPACAAGTLLQRLGVSDATLATPGSAYVGSGTYTIAVECTLNSTGTAYAWIID
jgi:hypothetical protein